MNKDEAKARIEAIEHEAAELRRIIEAPEWKPEDLVGKLCYVWDEEKDENRIRKITKVVKSEAYPFEATSGDWKHAEPVPAAEVEKMIYRKSRYDWSKAPSDTKIAVTQDDGCVFWGSYSDASPAGNGGWDGIGDGAWFDGPCVGECSDWIKSLEHRP